MWKTVLFLIFTLLVVPILAFNFDEPLSILQQTTLTKLVSIYLVVALLCFFTSLLTKNHSQVDKLWSIIPLVYCWLVCFDSGFEPRIVLMSILVTLWGIRLSYNFSRRGGYQLQFWGGEEDYRWAILRKRPEFSAIWKWQLFNFFFISMYQMGLILLMTLPILKCMNGSPLGIGDFILALVFLTLLVIEFIADQQQWNYQTEKHRRLAAGEALGDYYGKGFTHTGLWAIVRHPNYAAEQSIWVAFYLFSIVATGHWINWTMTGCLLLLFLFRGSSDFSEKVSASKYPDYKNYQVSTPRFLPFSKGMRKE